jgi:hypothetical protein
MKQHATNRLAQWKTHLNVEALEERSLMSASPLNWTAPAGSTANNIRLSVINNQIDIFDNGNLVANQDVAATSAITITTAARAKNAVTIVNTPAGLLTTINLKGIGDSVFVGDTGETTINPLAIKSTILSGITTIGIISTISLGGSTTPTIAAATMENILGAVTINGILAGHDSVTLADAIDKGSHKVVLTSTSVTGLAPAAINFTGISQLTVDGSSGHSGYAVSGAAGRTDLVLEGLDAVSVTSTKGTVNVYGKLFDSAGLVGPAAGINNLTASPGGATLSGAGYSNHVVGFTRITVTSRSASDVATLNGSAGGGNTFTASPTDAVLSHGIDTVDAANFHHVTANGTGAASDVATLTGAATGNNILSAFLNEVIITGTGYYLCAMGFGNASAVSQSATDTASMIGSFGGNNTFIATPTQAIMGNTGFRVEIDGCHAVTAYGNTGDTAYLFGASTGVNTLSATPTSTSLAGAGYNNTVTHFAYVYAYSESAGDSAYINGKGSFLFATPTMTQLSGAGYFVQSANFPSTYEYLTATTFEMTSSGSLLEQVSPVLKLAAAVVTHAPSAIAVGGLHNITSFWTTVDTSFDTLAIGKLVNANYVWDCNHTGIHIFGAAPTGAAVGIVLTLNDMWNASIQSVLFRDMVRDGGLFYGDMLDTFNVVEEGATVDATTLQDLQLLVRCASTLEMPADVADLANSVINGQAANGTFRSLDANGNVHTYAMGNLQAGSSTYTLTQLVDTWFLGSDEPDSARSYSAVQGTLFGSGGPVYTDVRQGSVGDCWLMASAAEVAARDPGYITSMFTYLGTNTVNGASVGVYSVRLYSHEGFGVPHYVTVDTELPAGGGMYDHPVNGVLWVALLEKAYAEASAAGWVTTSHGNSNSYGALDGGWPSYALPALTNLSTYEHSINASAAATAFQAGDMVVLCTGDSPSSNAIVPDHCYALVAYTPASASPFKVYNPWGTDANGNAGTYNGHTVFGLFNATAAFINSNFNEDSIGSAAPESAGDDVMAMLASSQTGKAAYEAGIDEMLLALAEVSHAHQAA